jgi:lambda family phage tail tape measure protein
VQNEADETFAFMTDAFTGWASSYSRELNDMLWDSELTFGGILESFGRMVTEMLIQSAMADITGALFGSKGGGSGSGIVGMAVSAIGSYFASEHGNAFVNGRHIEKYARGGIVDKPTVFPMARGVGLMGEAGPEAVMPLTRTSSGDLGVRAEGRQQQTNYFNVTVQAPDGNISKESQRQLQRRLTRSVAMANRRA